MNFAQAHNDHLDPDLHDMKVRRPRSSIVADLRAHISGEGTLNDQTTEDLYREWFRLEDESETCLEEVERWAVKLLS